MRLFFYLFVQQWRWLYGVLYLASSFNNFILVRASKNLLAIFKFVGLDDELLFL